MRRVSRWAGVAVLAAAGGGCATGGDGGPPPAPAPALPESARPAAALADLAFLTGRWVGVNPNGTVNDEMWTPPRGNSMAALFRQVRRDGKPALHEVSLITAEPEGVVLRLRHLHALLEVPERRREISNFRLVSAGGNRCEFAGTGASAQVVSVVYRLDGPETLVVEVAFAPESKEQGYTMRYRRER
ncbi:MAG: hypothetical protein JNJ48_05265 [Phycisphaerae bacterium]|nr:hypothetical protein [Phycisphaerae bacterium]